MKVVHLVLSDSFAGIEQHVNELLSNELIKNPILITNKSISNNFNKNITIHTIKNIGRRSLFGKYKLNKLLKEIDPDIVHTHGSKTTSIISRVNQSSQTSFGSDYLSSLFFQFCCHHTSAIWRVLNHPCNVHALDDSKNKHYLYETLRE